MKSRMTRERLREKVKTLYGGAEADQMLELADQIWKLADVELCLREIHEDGNTKTIPYALDGRRKTKRIFRLGFEPGTGETERLAIDFPFWTWKDKHSKHHEYWGDLDALRKKLLQRLHEYRLDAGDATRDVRLELAKGSIDVLVDAIRSIRSEVQQHL